MRLENRWYNLDEIIGSLMIYETKQLKSKDLYFVKPKLALQFLVRDILLLRKRIDRSIYDKYLALATELHLAAYKPTKTFEKSELE
jgi:hypothetical protein